MRIRILAVLALVSLAPVFTLAAEEGKPEVQAVFLHNGQEYPPDLLGDIEESGSVPEELSRPILAGDTLGWRRFANGSLEETVSGAVAKDGKVAFPNGVEFSTEGMSVFRCLLQLRSIYLTFHSFFLGYPAGRDSLPPAPGR